MWFYANMSFNINLHQFALICFLYWLNCMLSVDTIWNTNYISVPFPLYLEKTTTQSFHKLGKSVALFTKGHESQIHLVTFSSWFLFNTDISPFLAMCECFFLEISLSLFYIFQSKHFSFGKVWMLLWENIPCCTEINNFIESIVLFSIANSQKSSSK